MLKFKFVLTAIIEKAMAAAHLIPAIEINANWLFFNLKGFIRLNTTTGLAKKA